MFGDPGLALGDQRIVHLAIADQGRKRLLADVMPIEQVQACDPHRLLDPQEARDQEQA